MCATIVAVEKQYTHSECMLVALRLQHAVRMSRTVICGLSGSTAFFSTLSQERHFFEKQVTERKLRVLNLSTANNCARYDHTCT